MDSTHGDVLSQRLLLVVVVLTSQWTSNLQTATSRILEYCDTEVLRAECADDHVIMMERARYGRMKLGRCVEMEMGHIGCFTDVTKMADRRCSGRRVCELRVPDAEFESTEPCLKELKSYLDASYVCLKLENRGKECWEEGESRGPAGYISNEVREDGGIPCPNTDQSWTISGKPGQHVRLSLYDFSIPDEPSTLKLASAHDLLVLRTTPGSPAAAKNQCRQYGTVYDSQREGTHVICGSEEERISHIYTSAGHNVKLYLQAVHPSLRYLVRFSVEGCPWPALPEGAWFQNMSLNTIVISCTFSNSTWYLKCSVGIWSDLGLVACPKFPLTTPSSTTAGKFDQPRNVPFQNSPTYSSSSSSSSSKLGRKSEHQSAHKYRFHLQGNEFHEDDRFVEFAGLLATTITAVIAIVVLLFLIIKVSRETQKQSDEMAMKRNSVLLKDNVAKDVCWKKESVLHPDLNENQRLLTTFRADQDIPSAV